MKPVGSGGKIRKLGDAFRLCCTNAPLLPRYRALAVRQVSSAVPTGCSEFTRNPFYDLFESTLNFRTTVCVVDGSYLLHKVVWGSCKIFLDRCNSYTRYIKEHFGDNCTVLFDGYDCDSTSTKTVERNRRAQLKHPVDVMFDEHTSVTTKQEDFLSDSRNKHRLTHLLHKKLSEAGVSVILCEDGAHRSIVLTAIEKRNSVTDEETPVIIVGKDVDLVVLMIALAPPAHRKHLFYETGARKVGIKTIFFS